MKEEQRHAAVVALWVMLFSEPPVVRAETDLLLEILRERLPDADAFLDCAPRRASTAVQASCEMAI